MKIIEVAENLQHIVRVENVPNKSLHIQIERKARRTQQLQNINPVLTETKRMFTLLNNFTLGKAQTFRILAERVPLREASERRNHIPKPSGNFFGVRGFGRLEGF